MLGHVSLAAARGCSNDDRLASLEKVDCLDLETVEVEVARRAIRPVCHSVAYADFFSRRSRSQPKMMEASKNRYMGTDSTPRVMGSPDGVNTATSTTMPTMA